MAALSSKDIERSLLRKGFRYRDGDHRYLHLYVEGKKTTVQTKVSHGTRADDYGDVLLTAVKKQLRLHSRAELVDLVRCPMSQQQYEAILRSQGCL